MNDLPPAACPAPEARPKGLVQTALSTRTTPRSPFRERRGRGPARRRRQTPPRVNAHPVLDPRTPRLIVGAAQASAIATLVERKTRVVRLVRLAGDHSAQTVGDALIGAFTGLPAPIRRTLTWDQGNELFHHARIESQTGLRIYFADPHSPWQRGSSENTNGLLRQYFPKGTDLSPWSQDHLDEVAAELNDRPRACLGDQSPTQAMTRLGLQHHQPRIRDVR